ncbi:hypothetical protein C8F01DRAFT_1087933 [Mycena amicta]|nr:hypothetical protein C8F01DRAFT_1087933 [Mycena amicta]
MPPRCPSRASLTSSCASESSTPYTTTSSSTQWGLGALSGKAILALGKATIRGAERIVILRRMRVIREYLGQAGADKLKAESFMLSLVEDLSRPAQISISRTTHTVKCLSEWSLDGLHQLVAEIISVSLFCQNGFLEPRLCRAHSSRGSGLHSHLPAVAFISELMQSSETAYEAVLLAGFLEFVLLISWSHSPALEDLTRKEQAVISRTYSSLATPPTRLAGLWEHCLSPYSSLEQYTSVPSLLRRIRQTDPDNLKMFKIKAKFLLLELHSIFAVTVPPKRLRLFDGELEGILGHLVADPITKCAELNERYSQKQLMGISSPVICISVGVDVLPAMLAHFRPLSFRTKVYFLSGFIYLLLPASCQTSSSKFPDPKDRIGPPGNMSQALLDFLFAVVEHSDENFMVALKHRPAHSKWTLKLLEVVKERKLASMMTTEIADIIEPLIVGCMR